MCQDHDITDELIGYHTAVARGGIGMTTLAYAAVSRDGLSFPHQLWLRRQISGGLGRITDSVHAEGAAISVQIGHCGNMADRKVSGQRPLAPSGGINLYGPTFPRKMDRQDIKKLTSDFSRAAALAAECGFDAVEVHAGHGYLISQFLSPYTNRRKDIYGGSFANRSRLMREVLTAVKAVLPRDMALIVKMNSSDGFKGGITAEESLLAATMAEECGADAIVVSGGFVSKAPMFVLRGRMPVDIMACFMKDKARKFMVRHFGRRMIAAVPFREGYFMAEASAFASSVAIPIILVGGMNSAQIISKALEQGFPFIAFARALIADPAFVNELRSGMREASRCTVCNYCVATMYSGRAVCHMNESGHSPALRELIKKLPHG
jgi:2,4-dienoyl-CoA reductase-like NADH-dependent reductase (Old Yellow Enzyme family)